MKGKGHICEKNDELELTITDLGNDGQGIGHVDGYTLFVKGGIPGERLRVKVLKTKKNYGYAKLVSILREAAERVEPPCPLSGRCGGCQLQHLSYEKQLQFKEEKVANCMRRIAGLSVYTKEEWQKLERERLQESGPSIAASEGHLWENGREGNVPVILETILRMETPLHYRNKAQFPVGYDKDGNIITGFYAGRTHSIIPTTECLIQHPVNTAILQVILDYMQRYHVPAYDEKTGRGMVRHILTRVGKATGEIMVCLVINGDCLPEQETLVRALQDTNSSIVSICLNHNKNLTNAILGERVTVLYGKTYIEDKIGDVRFQISPLSFYQVNPEQTEKLYNTVLEYAELSGNEIVWDLYCGIGTISLFLAQKAAKVYGVEIVPQAVEDARNNAKLNGLKNVDFYVGAAEDVVQKEHAKAEGGLCADVVTLDPPRKGCDEKLLQTVVEMQPKRIVYVSCDPATLARDLKYFCQNGYELMRIRACDMFGMSFHVESVCLLHRRDS